MRKTPILGLPIYDSPSSDTFNLQDWNSANQNIEHMFAQYQNLKDAIPDELKSRLSDIETIVRDAIGEEELNAIADKIRTMQELVDRNSEAILLKADIGELHAVKAEFDTVKAKTAEMETLVAGKASIEDLQAANANIGVLQAGKASVVDLSAVSANISNLNAKTAILEDVLAGNITAENISAGVLTVINGWMLEGAIGSAQISSLDVNKLSAGDIDTSKIRIVSRDGSIEITGDQILINDVTDPLNPYNRIAIGKVKVGERLVDGETGEPIELPPLEEGQEYEPTPDIEGAVSESVYDYSILVRAKDGSTVMMDGINGVYNAGITDGAIDNNKVADDANIAGNKLDINSVIREYNDNGSVTINGTKILVGDKTLDVELSEQKNLIIDNTTELSTQKSQIEANEAQIALKVSTQDYNADKTDMTQRLTTTESSITALQGEIALKVEATDISKAVGDAKSEVNSTIDGKVAEIKITTDSITSYIEQSKAELEGEIARNTASIELANDYIENTVKKEYVRTSDLEEYKTSVESSLKQTSDNITATFNRAIDRTEEVQGELAAYKNEVESYIRFDENGIELGKSGNKFTTQLDNTQLAFKEDGQTVSYISNQKMKITHADIDRLDIGGFSIVIEDNGSLSIVGRS